MTDFKNKTNFNGAFCGLDCPYFYRRDGYAHNRGPVVECRKHKKYREYSAYTGFRRCEECLRQIRFNTINSDRRVL